jgi:putative transposase
MEDIQPHRKTVKHYHEPGHLHELTFSCYKRMPLLTNDDWRKRLAACIEQANQEEAMQLVAFVFMPEHVHLLICPESDDPQISRNLARLKQPFSKQIKEVLVTRRSTLLDKLTVRERPGKTCFRFWQEGPGFDRNIFSPKAITASIDYIHKNPVERDLCRRAIDWKWSSARYYHADPPRQQHPDLPVIHGLPVGALDEPLH